MPFVVKQISKGHVVDDYDERLTPKDGLALLEKHLGNLDFVDGITRSKIPIFNNTAIFFAQITYLGKPHPIYKKRIQIKNIGLMNINFSRKRAIKSFFLAFTNIEILHFLSILIRITMLKIKQITHRHML